MNNLLKSLTIASLISTSGALLADDYVIDTKGSHASINFKIPHLGFSMVIGRFNEFEGSFSYDENKPGDSTASVKIDTASLDSNHAERDKHLKSGDFLNTDKYPEAQFVSSSYAPRGDKTGVLTGDLTLHGVTKSVEIAVVHVGGGDDPWGGYRQGFSGTTTLTLADFGISTKLLGPASTAVELSLEVEGIRQ